jgi:hypothetical protein
MGTLFSTWTCEVRGGSRLLPTVDSEAGEGIKHLPGLGGRGRLPAGLQNAWYGFHRQFCHALSENGIMSYDSFD